MASGLLLLFVTVGLAAVVIGQEYDLPDDCGPCDPEKCVNPVKCPAGRTLDRCQCCETCSKGLYELCFDAKAEMRPGVQYGKCGKNLECRLRDDIPESEGAEAICYCVHEDTVCGTDGVTYENICQLNAVKNMGDGTLDKDKDGPCTSAPRVVTGPENVKNKTGTDITLSCEVMGYPIPTIEWSWKRVNLEVIQLPTDDYHVSVSTRGGPEKFEVTGFLQIEDLRKEHEGDYICVANNKEGEDSAKARVNVVVDKEHEKKFHGGKKHHRGGNGL